MKETPNMPKLPPIKVKVKATGTVVHKETEPQKEG